MTGNIGVNSRAVFISKAKENLVKLIIAKRLLCKTVRQASEEMADRIAREGLFGEDREQGYRGTELDYIPENALEIKYINVDRCLSQGGERLLPAGEKSGVLRCFNGF